jgi:hypothetical protein
METVVTLDGRAIADRFRTRWAVAERWQIILAFLAYALAMNFAHSAYLQPRWGYFGYSYVQPTFWRYAAAAVLVCWGALVVPAGLSRASSLFSIALGLVIYVPTVVITLGLSDHSLSQYGGLLFAVALAYGAICLPAQLAPDTSVGASTHRLQPCRSG